MDTDSSKKHENSSGYCARTEVPLEKAAVFTEEEGQALEANPTGVLIRALENEDVMRVARALRVITERSLEGSCSSVFHEGNKVVKNWRSMLKEGDQLDTFCERDKVWYPSKVVKVDPSDILIHYQGWTSKYDTVYHKGSKNLQPYCSMTRKEYREKRNKRPNVAKVIRQADVQNENMQSKDGFSHASNESSAEAIHLSKFGREVKTKIDFQETQSKRKKPSCSAVVVSKVGPDFNDPYCCICLRSEELLCCDGPCLRSYCKFCLELEQFPEQDKWQCEDCTRGEHPCLLCSDHGEDNKGNNGVFKCSLKSCGAFFHHNCAMMNPNFQIRHAPQRINQDGVECLEDGEAEEAPPKFRCSYHTCDTCNEAYSKGASKTLRGRCLYRCARCPRAYHINCIPPNAMHNDLCLLCPLHPDLSLPPIPEDENSAGSKSGQESEREDTEEDWLVRWAQWASATLPLKSAAPSARRIDNPLHFRLPVHIGENLESKPPPFHHVLALKYLCKPSYTMDSSSICTCTVICDESCLNRILTTECTGDNPENDKKRSKLQRKYDNCSIGPGCNNRQLQNRDYAKVQPFKEGNMGWGLRTLEPIKAGKLVTEYVGEVFTEAEMEQRLHQQSRKKENAYYIMQLDAGLYVDARYKGNLSRFINHSCDPNCELQKWTVAGQPRIGIFAKKNIPANASLSYDYQFSTQEEDFFTCHCGAAKCRGTMAPKKLLSPPKARLTKHTKAKLVKARKLQMEKCQARVVETNKKRLSLTSRYLPGDPVLEVRQGPPKKYYKNAQESRLFLVRNTEEGNNFLKRQHLWNRRSQSIFQEIR